MPRLDALSEAQTAVAISGYGRAVTWGIPAPDGTYYLRDLLAAYEDAGAVVAEFLSPSGGVAYSWKDFVQYVRDQAPVLGGLLPLENHYPIERVPKATWDAHMEYLAAHIEIEKLVQVRLVLSEE